MVHEIACTYNLIYHISSVYSCSLCIFHSLGEETGSGGLGTRELIGIAVGVAIVMVMVLLCCILVVCAYISKGKVHSHVMHHEGCVYSYVALCKLIKL